MVLTDPKSSVRQQQIKAPMLLLLVNVQVRLVKVLLPLQLVAKLELLAKLLTALY
jgi:hypothetical protein